MEKKETHPKRKVVVGIEREKSQYQQSLQSPTEPHSLTLALIHIPIVRCLLRRYITQPASSPLLHSIHHVNKAIHKFEMYFLFYTILIGVFR